MSWHRVPREAVDVNPILPELGLVTVGTEAAWAVVSPDDRYRYLLGRCWDSVLGAPSTRPVWLFGMVNPSDAREEDDPTVRKCIGFAKRGGAGGLLVVNLLGVSSPYPKDVVEAVKRGEDVVGKHNEAAIAWALAQASVGRRVAAWGRILPKLVPHAQAGIRAFLAEHRHPAECFGLNDDRTPHHPLMLGYDTPIVAFVS
jgi:hypothetical protein